MNKETIVVNLLGGPCSGKSTFCASIFAQLKWKEVNCEMALEYAKDHVWEGTEKILENQFYVFGQQQNRLYRLNGKVDVIITDSPLLLSIIYDAKKSYEFRNLILKEHNNYNNMNFFIERAKPYNSKGRLQTEKEAKQIDLEIKEIFHKNNIIYETIRGIPENSEIIVNKILKKLKSISS